MSADEPTKDEAKRGPEEDKTRTPAGCQPDGNYDEPPLFLRGISDGHKGNAQDEKDGVGE
jgi:hypothetical protein